MYIVASRPNAVGEPCACMRVRTRLSGYATSWAVALKKKIKRQKIGEKSMNNDEQCYVTCDNVVNSVKKECTLKECHRPGAQG